MDPTLALRRGSPLALVGLATLLLAPTANAQTTKCAGNHYLLIDPAAFPAISNERANNLPRLTSGYAPRCLVADRIAGDIQLYGSQHQRLPRSLHVGGARWNAGEWQLGYTVRHNEPGNSYRHPVARHGHESVTMDLTS